MKKAWWHGLLVLLLIRVLAAEEPTTVKFLVDPPDFKVYRKATVTGGLRPGQLSAQPQESELAQSQGGYWVLPPECFKTDSFDLVFRAPGYQDETKNFKKFDFRPGANSWPKDGQVLVLQARGLAAISQILRLHPVLSGIVILGLSGLGIFFLSHQWLSHRQRQWHARIQALGGDPSDKPIGPFVPVGLLGQGGFGVVVKGVRREELFRPQPEVIAVKTLLHVNLDEQLQDSDGESRRQRFRREAQVLERLEHPHIVRLVHYALDGATPYLAMEFIDGESFSDIIRRHPTGMPPAEALRLILPVCEAMLYAHTRNPQVIHRDIKPENLMLARNGEVKVMDLGLAHSLGERRITKTHEWTGTPQYASAEYLSGVVTPALDQYAIGLVLFELLVGQAANPHAAAERAVHAVLLGELPRLAKLRPEWGDFSQAVDRMSDGDYTKRFPSLAEAMEALKKYCPA